MPNQLRHHALHIASLEHYLILLCLISVREKLRLSPLIESKLQARCRGQVKSARKGLESSDTARRNARHSARIDAAAEVRSQFDVTDQLTIDRLLEQAMQFFDVLFFGCALPFRELVVPIGAGNRYLAWSRVQYQGVRRREQPHAFEKRKVRKNVL